MRVVHAVDCLAHAQQDGVGVERAVLDQVACHRIERIVFENNKVPAFTQSAVAIANGHLPVLRGNVMEYAGRDHQVEFGIGAEIVHRHETAGRILLSRDGKALGRRVAADDVGVRKDFAQMPHTAADAATEIEHRVDASD